MKKLIRKYNLIFQVIVWIAAGLYLIPSLVSSKITSSNSFDKVQSALSANLDPAVYEQQDQVALMRYLNLDPSQFTGSAFYRIADAMSANEMVLVQFDTAEAAQAFEEAATSRKDSQYKVYSGYAPEQAAIMENAIIDVQGNYGIYYAGDNPLAVDEAFLSALRGTL